MKKTLFCIVTLLLAVKAIAQAEPAGYAKAMGRFMQYYNHDQPDSIFSMFSPQMKEALPIDKFKPTTIQLKSQYGNLIKTEFVKMSQSLAIYKAVFQNSTFFLNLIVNSQNKLNGLSLSPYRDEAGNNKFSFDPSLEESPIVLKTITGTISGSLVMPKNPSGKIPVVLIIPDEGPTDRDGNNEKMGISGNTYKILANDLGKNNIATLRYDKRLVGASVTKGKESELRIEDYNDDAFALINMLTADQRFSKVIVFGHGQGALVANQAILDTDVKGLITAEWPADRADKVLTERLKGRAQYMQDEFKTFLDSLKKGKTTDNIDAALYFIAKPSMQNFIMSWCRYEPLRTIKKVKVPMLIIQGTTDKLVTVDNGQRLKKAKSEAQYLEVKNMNHILKEAPADEEQNVATYDKPDLPLKPEIVPAIVEFVKRAR